MNDLLADPFFYAVAVPAVILVGLSKGGLGGAAGLMGVPLLSLATSPLQAAAILLPILVVMDIVALWSWRGQYDRATLRIVLPGAMLGIAIGWATAALVTATSVRLIVGLMALAFSLHWLWQRVASRDRQRSHSAIAGTFWGTVSGFTSFVAHAGGPPYQIYAMALKLDPRLYTGTSAIFFAVVNAVKLVPYFMLGQFDTTNLTASAILMPIAPLATLAGAWLVRRMNAELFYIFMYGVMFLVALKLIWDGMVDILP